MSPQEWLATQQTAPAASAPLSPEQWLATQKPATNAAEGPPSAAVPFVPESRNIRAQGEKLRNRLPVTPVPVVAPTVAQPTDEPTEKELAIASQPYRFQVPTRRVTPVAPQVERPVEPPPTESELAIAQKPAFGNTIIDRQGKVIRSESVEAPIVLPVPEEQSVARQFADVPLQLTKGTVSGVRSIADFFGADSETSKVLRSSEDYLGRLMSAQSQNDSKEIARIKQEVQDKGIEAQIGGAIRALGVAPIDTLVNALGTSAPALIGGIATAFFGAPAAVATGVGVGIGAMMGAGTIKGTIYEETKKALIGAGVDPEIADKTAQEAQKYNGKNLDNILLGGGLGALAGKTGIESVLIKGMVNKILARSATVDSAKNLAKDYAKNNFVTITQELAKAGIYEGAPEFLQGFQEAVAANIAQQREGLADVPTFRGAVFAGVLEGLAGVGLGSGVKGVELSKDATLSPSQKIGKALQQDIAEKGYTQEGSRREALARLNPDQAQYTSTAAPARRPQAPQGTVTAAPIAPAVVAVEPKTEAVQVVPAAEEVAPLIEEQRVVPKGLLTPRDFESPAVEDLEDPSVTPVTLEEGALPEFPTQEEKLKYYFANNKNIKSEDIVVFDDATFFKQPDGSYADVPDASKQEGDITYSSIDEIKESIKDNFVGTTFNDFLLTQESFSTLNKINEPEVVEPSVIKEPEATSVTDVTPKEQEQKPHEVEGLPTVYPLVSKLKMSKDVPQFKYGANEKGVVEPLGGTFDTTSVAPIQVWVRRNGDLEVISGRHRLDLAKRSGRVTIPAQYHYEANGFDKERAAILDAELNIRDNQGKVKDYVNYFKGAKLSREEADSRGLLAKDLGKRGYTIANEGSEELIAAHRGDVVGDEAAYLIAKNAPQDGRLQSVGIKAIQDGKSMSAAINTMQAVKALAGESQTSVDMFGFDDSAMKEADEMAKIAARKQREISQRLSAITGAAKNPALAKAEGIDIKDPAAVKKRIEELRQLKTSWDNWSTNPDLVAEIRQERGPQPLTLTSETEAETKEREKKEKEAKAAEEKSAKDAEAKEKEERQGGMFDEEEKTSPITRIKDKLIRFASGMTAIKDLVNGAYARSGNINYGIGVDVGLLSDNGIKALANAILNLRVPVFVDSGAFSNFTKTIKGKEVKPLDFDKILEKYDQITEEISNQNDAENTDYPRPMFVMPDIVGNQAASIDLIKKHKTWIKVELSSNLSQPIIPIQKGDISLADAYKEIVSILGTDKFIVGIPSAEAAVSKDELAEFLKEAKPKRVHFLGSAADSKLNPKIAIVAQYSPDTNVTADASKVRSAILNGVAEGKTREQAITDALTEEGDQGYLMDLYGPKEEKKVETKTEEREPVKGDRFKDGKGNEFEIWSSRQGSILAHPVVNGKAVVNRESLQLWAIGDLARARFPERRTDYFPVDTTKPTEATAKTEESDNKKVEAALEKLNDKDVGKLEDHYGDKKNTDGFATKLRADIQLAIEKGINAVAKGIRNVIRKLLATILAVGVAFNPVTFNAESQAFNIPSIQKTELVKIVENPKANFGAITPSVTTARLAHYVVGTNDNEGLPFIITDKPIATSYVFDAKGNLVAAAPVLLGAAKYADVIPSSAIEKTVSQTTKEEKVTPAGRFKGKIEPYKSGTSFDFIKLGNSSLAGHIAYTGNPLEKRLQRLSTPTADDNFISYGCINYGETFYEKYIEKQFADGGIQYITPMSQTLEQTFEGIAGYQPTTTIVTSIVSNPQSAFNVSKHSEQGVLRSPRTNVTLPSRRRQEGKPDSAETNLIGNKRLSEQPADVREALAAGFRGTTDDAVLWQDMFLNLVDEDVTGKELLDVMSNRNDERQADPVELSMAISALYSIGLDGIIDEGGSRTSFIPKEYDLKKESDVTDKLAAENPAESKALNEMDQLPTAKKKLPPGRSPELAAAAQMVKDGTMPSALFDSLVNKYKPIYLYTASLVPAPTDKMVDALDSAKKGKVNPQIQSGTAVGLRLDIPAFTRKGVYVVSIHNKGTKSGPGKVIGYSSVAKVTNARFGLGNQNAALAIASGAGKDALQTIEGSYVFVTPEQAYEQAKAALNDPAWTQIGIDPTRHSYFYDRRTTMPVVAAEEILQIGNMVLGKGITFGKKENFLFNIDSQPPLTAGELAQRNTDIRREQINEYAGLRRRMASAVGKVAEGEVSTDLQRSLSYLISRSKYLKTAIDISTPTRTSPETFLAKALSEYDAGNISADVLAVVQDAYNKYPQLLDGIRLSVKSNGNGSNSIAMFVPLARIVRLFKSTTGATDPKSIRHELNHSLEQMMSGAQRQVVFDAWLKDLQKASEKNKDEAHQNFFNAVINFIENPSEANHEKAVAAMPSYEMYQYVDPSEYWAVNAEKLMARQLGTAWQRFKLFVQRMFEGLKSVFGFDNKYAVHKVFNQIMSGEMSRISRSQLVDMVTGDNDFAALNNLQDDMDLLERYGHAHTPTSGTSSLKKAVLAATTKAKQIYKQGVEDPKSLAIDTITYADRATIYLRNKNVWYGTGLDAAEYGHFKGQMRDTNGMVNASIALDNAIRATAISSQVVLNGGIKYDPNSLNYVAEKRDKGMVGVYKAESIIKKKLGNQLGTDIIQGYLEAKRSLSIRNELVARKDQIDQLTADLITLKSNPNADPDDIKALKMEIAAAKKGLAAIEMVERKVSMSNGEIRDFLARARAHPELRDIMTNFNATNQNLLVFWRDVGLISDARYELLSNIKDYIPWYRIMEDGTISADTDEAGSALQSTTRSMTNIGKEKLFKAGRPSVSTRFTAKQGQQTFKIQPSRVVGVEINENPVNPNDVQSSPNGEVTINVPINEGDIVEFKTNREIQNMIDNMTRSVMRMTMNGLRKHASNAIVKRYATRNQNGQIKVFPKADKNLGLFNYVANGRNIVVEIEDKLIAEAIFGMENIDIKMLWGFNAVANFTRRLITIDPTFQFKQLIQDMPMAAWASGTKHWYKLLGGVLKDFVYTLVRPLANKVGVTLTGNQNFDIEPVVRTLQLAGVGGYHIPSRTAEKEVKMQIGIMNQNVYQFILKALDHIGDASDVAPRIATYKQVLAETGDEALALYRAANVINFQHRGSGQIAQILVKTVPFTSAYANATDVLAQTLAGGGLKGKSRKAAIAQMAITGTSLGIITLLIRCAIGDDDEYKKYDDKTRYGNYLIPGTDIMLPMHNSGAFFFKVLPEFLYDKYIEESTNTPKDKTRLKEALKTAAIDMLLGPTPVPSAAKSSIEVGLDHSFVTGRTVVPAGLKGVEAAEQYTATTSELGKYISSVTRDTLNPIQADHIIRGMFGSVGALSQWASNMIGEAAEKRPAPTAKQNPFYGAFIKPVQRGPEDLFYDFKERVEKKYKTMQLQIDRQDVKGVISNVEENKRLIAMHDYVINTNEELGKLNKIIREISEGKMNTMSPQEKRKTIELVQRAKNLTLTGVENMRSISGL